MVEGCTAGVITPRLKPPSEKVMVPDKMVQEINSQEEDMRSLIANGQLEFSSDFYQGELEFVLYFLESPVTLKATLYSKQDKKKQAVLFYNQDTLILLTDHNCYATNQSTLQDNTLDYSFPIRWFYGALWGEANLLSDSILVADIKGEEEKALMIDYPKHRKRLLLGWTQPKSQQKTVVLSQQILDKGNNLIADFSYDSLKCIDNFYFPSKVKVVDFRSGSWVNISYHKIEVNKDIDKDSRELSMPVIPEGRVIKKLYR